MDAKVASCFLVPLNEVTSKKMYILIWDQSDVEFSIIKNIESNIPSKRLYNNIVLDSDEISKGSVSKFKIIVVYIWLLVEFLLFIGWVWMHLKWYKGVIICVSVIVVVWIKTSIISTMNPVRQVWIPIEYY